MRRRAMVIILLFAFQAMAQTVFDSVAISQRSNLKTRLRLLVRYEKNNELEKLFALVSPISSYKSKKEFLEAKKRLEIYRLVSFSPSTVGKSPVPVDHEQLFIYGNITVLDSKGLQECYKGRLVADLVQGQWYFVPILDSMIGPIGQPPEKCDGVSDKEI